MNFNTAALKLKNFKKVKGFPSSTLYETEVDSCNCSLLNEFLPIASQETKTRGANFVVEDHQLQGLSMVIVHSTSSQVENPPFTVRFSCVVSEQNNGDVLKIIFWKRKKGKSR